MIENLKNFLKKFNSSGFPIPLLRDPKTGPSVSLTLLFISSLYVQVGLIGKYSKLLDGIDVSQAINWYLITAGLYFGRNLSTKNVTSNEKDKNAES